MDSDLRSIQQARTLLAAASEAENRYHAFDQTAVDRIVAAMIEAGSAQASQLAEMAVKETGFGRVESKRMKNIFATRTLGERMQGMKTCGIVRKTESGSVWEIASPMGVVAALVPSTNPTSTAMYKAIISAKARCALVMSPHPRAATCTAEALNVVARAAYEAGAPAGLFGCITEVSISGTNALLEDDRTSVILATGGSAMVRAAYSKGKPAYGVGSGNVPVYVDRSADLVKAAKDIVFGAFFDHGTLCSTERSIVADMPIKKKLTEELRRAGAHILSEEQKRLLTAYVAPGGNLNIDQVGKSPTYIAEKAGFSVPPKTRALVAAATRVGKEEPLSMETLSPILTLYEADGWEAGCERCKKILSFGGIGHTLGIHATSQPVIEAFGLEKPAMRIVVNSVCALGSVGYTTRLFPAMTLGPGTVGGSITSHNISPMDLVNIKRMAFETNPIHPAANPSRFEEIPAAVDASPSLQGDGGGGGSWIAEIEARLRDRAGSMTDPRPSRTRDKPHNTTRNHPGGNKERPMGKSPSAVSTPVHGRESDTPINSGAAAIETDHGHITLSDNEIENIISKFRKS